MRADILHSLMSKSAGGISLEATAAPSLGSEGFFVLKRGEKKEKATTKKKKGINVQDMNKHLYVKCKRKSKSAICTKGSALGHVKTFSRRSPSSRFSVRPDVLINTR